MAEDYEKERTLEQTATWAVAVVCFVILAISLLLEKVIHLLEKFLKKKRKVTLVEALVKFKSELMLLGFISFLLTLLQDPISNMCVPRKIANSWLPCKLDKKYGRRLLEFSEIDGVIHRSLATKGYDKCTRKGQYAFVTAYGIHQLHIFIFVLAVFHVLYFLATLALGNIKMRRWKAWEKETKTHEYMYFNDLKRFRLTRESSFGRRHMSFWSQWSVSVWMVCFFRQFFGSVEKVDYMILRHGFIKAHLPNRSESTFDFQDYIQRSLEDDFKVVVGISPVIWFSAVLFLLTNTHEWRSHIWLPIVTLFIVLLVGTKLQVIITKMGLRVQERGNAVKGIPVVQPSDELFWFGRPRLLLFLIHFILFQNAFQLAFFAWGTYSFGWKNCFHKHTADIVFRVSMGVFIQVLCGYVTLPLYALVTQMGSTMKPTIFSDHVLTAIKRWHNTAKKHAKQSRHSNADRSFSSRPTAPAPLLQDYNHRSEEGLHEVENQRRHELELTNESPQDHELPNASEIARHSDIVEEERPESVNQPSAPPRPTAPDHSDISLVGK